MPLVIFAVFWFIRLIKRFYDRHYSLCNTFNTRKTALQNYVDLYSGPNFMLHFKYSEILNICFVTFMFGFGLPILFPIAALNFTISYFTEKLMLYYSYKLPPMYDEKLNEIILRLLRYVPIVYLAFGYWMCSSN